jgi:hypothetical protein
MCVGAGGSRQPGGESTPSRRRWSTIFAAPFAPYPQLDYHDIRTRSDPASSRKVPFPHITVVASPTLGVCASLNCSIYYDCVWPNS